MNVQVQGIMPEQLAKPVLNVKPEIERVAVDLELYGTEDRILKHKDVVIHTTTNGAGPQPPCPALVLGLSLSSLCAETYTQGGYQQSRHQYLLAIVHLMPLFFTCLYSMPTLTGRIFV